MEDAVKSKAEDVKGIKDQVEKEIKKEEKKGKEKKEEKKKDEKKKDEKKKKEDTKEKVVKKKVNSLTLVWRTYISAPLSLIRPLQSHCPNCIPVVPMFGGPIQPTAK